MIFCIDGLIGNTEALPQPAHKLHDSYTIIYWFIAGPSPHRDEYFEYHYGLDH
jgi:hypothetical protein